MSQYRQESLGHVICAKEIHCEEPFERGAILRSFWSEIPALNAGSDKCGGNQMDSLVTAAAHALASVISLAD